MRAGQIINKIKAETGFVISRSTINNYRVRGLIKPEREENGEWNYPPDTVRRVILIHNKLTPLGFKLELIRRVLRKWTVRKIERELATLSGPEFKKWFEAGAKNKTT